MLKKLKGFTLSEVLIALTLIGVVSAMAVPSLLGNANTSKKMARFKKGYNTIVNAYSQMVSEKGEPTNIKQLADNIVSYLNVRNYYYYETNGTLTSAMNHGANARDNESTAWIVTDDGIGFIINKPLAQIIKCVPFQKQI